MMTAFVVSSIRRRETEEELQRMPEKKGGEKERESHAENYLNKMFFLLNNVSLHYLHHLEASTLDRRQENQH